METTQQSGNEHESGAATPQRALAPSQETPDPQMKPMASPWAPPRWRWSGSLFTSFQSLASTVTIAVFVITFIVQAFQIPSESMESTLLVGDYLLVDKVQNAPQGIGRFFFPQHEVKRGDIVVFRYPIDPDQYFVKRVIGTPGDHLRLREGLVYVNGHLLQEHYTQYLSHDRDPFRDDFPQLQFWNGAAEERWRTQLPELVSHGELLVPKNSYFVMGDNRDRSSDSRYWGLVPKANLVGRPLLIYWSMEPATHASPLASASGVADDRLSASEHRFRVRWQRMFRIVE